MKKTTVLFLFIALSVSAYSQSNNWYFSFSMGGSWPLSTFSKTDIDNNESGFAQKGFALLLDGTYPLNNHWGLKGMALMSTNPVDREGLGSKLEKRMNSVPITVDASNREYLSLKANSWMWNSLLAGPVYTINIKRRYWDFQVLGGMNVAYLPQQKLLYDNPANDGSYLDSNTSSTSVSYGLLAGTDLRFPVTDRINLKVGVNYYMSRAKVAYEQTRVTQQGTSVVNEKLGNGSNTIPIEMLSGTIGLVYYLN
jgi:hypothetical protein